MSAHRIVSLIASGTEIVSALGFEDRLVGRSHECDYPPSVLRLPACSEPKIDTKGTSREIDERVKTVLREALSVYHVHLAKLQELQPTVIVTQTQCEVCAVSLRDVKQAVCGLVGSQPKLVALEPNSVADVWNDIRLVAGALDADKWAERLVSVLQGRLVGLADRARQFTDKPSIACIEWIDPLMTAGNWVPELVKMTGGTNMLGEAGQHSRFMTWEDLVEADPDVIAIMPCGFDIQRTRRELPPLVERHGWPHLKAVRTRSVYLTDGNQYFNRPGPRLVESAEILAEILHPEAFDFGHRGCGWERL